MILNEFDSKLKLQQFGISIPKGYFIKDISDVGVGLGLIAAERYVIKIVSSDIIHKSDMGGVRLNIETKDVKEAIYKMYGDIHKKLPNAKIDGILLQEMCPPGIECIIGIKTDPNFGQIIVFGMGGVYAEIFHDISMRVLPIIPANAWEMVSETKIHQILKGARGIKYDINAITDTIIKVSQMSDTLKIKELDINPLIVYEKGVIALDARIMI